MNFLHFFDMQVALHRNREPRVYKSRLDPMSLSDREFKSHFRFNKDTVCKLVDLMRPDLEHETNRGLPLSPELKVCLALATYGGGHFQRVTGLCGGVRQSTARKAIVQVTDCLVAKRKQFIFMPSREEMEKTSQEMLVRFNLPRFALAVDGVQVRFQDSPRGLPHDKHAQLFWCRKQFYSLNVQIVGNERYFCDLDCSWPGSTHDARVWNRSQVKQYLEEQREFLVAADSGYPISEVVVKPYSTADAAQDPRRRKFNSNLSGLRTVMSENLYGIWKKRFPILKSFRTNLELSQKIIVATAVLFNIGQMLNDEPPDDGDDDEEEREQVTEGRNDHTVVVDETGAMCARMRGQAQRDILCENMRI